MSAQLACANDDVETWVTSKLVTPAYDCFSHLPWVVAPKKIHASPWLAKAWAQAIVNYWQINIASNTIDLDKPLYVLDMAPDEGQFAWLLLDALQHTLVANQLDLSFCLLACSNPVSEVGVHPYFREDIAAGRYDIAHWDDDTSSLHLQQQNLVIQQCENPLVIVGVDYFQTFIPELAGIHNGQVQSIDVAIIGEDKESYKLDYQWRLAETSMPSLAEPLLVHYRYECNGCTLMLPLQACRMLDALNHFADGRSLLLAMDSGAVNSQQIRLGALCPPVAWSKEKVVLPVNFHALELHQKQQGAHVWQQQLDDKGMVLHMAWRDDKSPISSQDFNKIVATLADAHPDDIHQLVTTQHNATDTLLFLRLSHYDPQVLKANIAALLKQPLANSACHNWQKALVRTWYNYLPTREYDCFYYQVGLLATHLGHFGLAKECLRLGLALYGDDATDLYLLAWCEAASGGTEPAIELLSRALVLAPEHPQCLALYAELQKRLDLWQQHEWYLPPSSQQTNTHPNSLRLEPLGDEHAVSFLYQYRDPQIGIMTRLPELGTLEQVHAWIAEQQQEKSRVCFAVMHECWGFVGLVSAHCAGNAGYFYFWMGSDFQGQGYGQQAAHLLFDLMQQSGVTEIFTSAYEDNLRSINALIRLGFEQLPFRAQSPDHELIFFHRNTQEGVGDSTARHLASRMALGELCNAIQSPLVF